MKGYQVVFSTIQSRQYEGVQLSEWLMKKAREVGIRGTTIINATKGFGHDGRLHSASFFELADQPIEIIMTISEDEWNLLLELLNVYKVGIFYTKTAVEYGTI